MNWPQRANTEPLPRPATRRLGRGLGLRTLPFRLSDVPPGPPEFSPERFSPKSLVLRLAGVELEVIDRPKHTLGEAHRLALVEVLRLTAENTPYHAGTYMHRHLEQAGTLIVIRQDGQVEGFSIATPLEIDGRQHLFINATMYSPAIRGKQLTAIVNLVHITRAILRAFPRTVYVAMRTQNPLVFSTCVSSAPFYPRPDEPTPGPIREAAGRLSFALNPDAVFDAEALVQRGILARDAVEAEPPRHRDPAVNAYCDQHLDYRAGDLFLMVAPFNLLTLARTLAINVRKALRVRRRQA